MDTCFEPLELDSLPSGMEPVSWPVGVIEEPSRLAPTIHDTFVQDLAGITPLFEAQSELQSVDLQVEAQEAKRFGDLVGQGAALRHVVSQIDVVAPTEASVLILGQTGTGKELVAHEIHRRSARKDGRLVRVNCAFEGPGRTL
jgi:transcriptional regulator with PAS, ATPase and Fis domain